MKLTKAHREAFVRAVMQDVPQIDYATQAHKLVKDANLASLPPQLRPIALDKELSIYLKRESYWFGHDLGISSVSIFSMGHSYFKLKDKDDKALDKIKAAAEKQIEQRKALEERVSGVINSCTTLKIAKERLPEFVKYLPEEQEKTQNLPAIANIVADLTKLGWPKDKQPATA